jgi:hypothetical protein
MKKLSKFLKVFLPFLILTGGISFVFLFEFYIKDKVNVVPVVVAKEDISFKEPITPENITIVNVKRDNLVKAAYYGVEEQHLQKLYGKLAAIDIKQGTQIYGDLLDTYDLVPDEVKGEFIAPIPNEWLFAVPGSLRRSYYADLYIVPGEKEKGLRQELTNLNEPKDGGNNEGDSTAEDKPIEATVESLDQSKSLLSKPILINVRVAHTKDNANREVRNVQDKDKDATGNISKIEIVANQEMLNTIRKYVDQGYKLYITYTFRQEGGNQ